MGILGPAAGSGMGRNETRRYSYCALYILMIVSLACEQSSIFFIILRKCPHVVSFVYVHNNRTWFQIDLYSFSSLSSYHCYLWTYRYPSPALAHPRAISTPQSQLRYPSPKTLEGCFKRGRSRMVSISSHKSTAGSTYSTTGATALASAVSGSTTLGAGSVSVHC